MEISSSWKVATGGVATVRLTKEMDTIELTR